VYQIKRRTDTASASLTIQPTSSGRKTGFTPEESFRSTLG